MDRAVTGFTPDDAGEWVASLECLHRRHVRLRARTAPAIDVVVEAGGAHAIPPEVEHEVEPSADARLFLEFLRAAGEPQGPRSASTSRPSPS